MSGKFTGNINNPAERSLRLEGSQNILSKERTLGQQSFGAIPIIIHSVSISSRSVSQTFLSIKHTPEKMTKLYLPPVALLPLSIFLFPSIFHLFFPSILFSSIFLSIFYTQEGRPCSRQSNAVGTGLRPTPTNQASSIISIAINLLYVYLYILHIYRYKPIINLIS